MSMRAPSKAKDTLSKLFPLRWSLGSKDRRKPDPVPQSVKEAGPVELVQYLESGRRPRCTKDSIVTLMNEPRSAKDAAEGQAPANGRSSSIGTVGCMGKTGDESSQVPEGQRRPSDKTASLRRSKVSQTRDETTANVSSSSSSNTLTRKKDSRKQSHSKVSQDTETKRGSAGGVQPSYSTPSLHDGTLRRQKGDRSDREHHSSYEGNSKTKKTEVPKGHEGLLSLLRANFLKKDKDTRKYKESESGKGSGEEGARRTLSRLSLSNGAAGGGTVVEGSRSNDSGHMTDEMANGKVGRSAASIKRSQSSSNIPTKAEQSMRRTASLHRNKMPAAPMRSLTTEKPSYGTLQRTRYSTTSLGRKRTVPESSF